VEVASCLHLGLGQLPNRVPDRLSIVSIGKISPTQLPVYEKEVIFSIFNFGLLLDGRHETLLIVETIPHKVSDLAGSPLDHWDSSTGQSS